MLLFTSRWQKILNLEEDSDITFTSDNKKVAKVNKNGKITGIKKGKAIITAEVKQNDTVYTYQMLIRVSDGTKDKGMMKYLK